MNESGRGMECYIVLGVALVLMGGCGDSGSDSGCLRDSKMVMMVDISDSCHSDGRGGTTASIEGGTMPPAPKQISSGLALPRVGGDDGPGSSDTCHG